MISEVQLQFWLCNVIINSYVNMSFVPPALYLDAAQCIFVPSKDADLSPNMVR